MHAYIGWGHDLAAVTWAQKEGSDRRYYGNFHIWSTIDSDGKVTNNCDPDTYNYYAMSSQSDWNKTTEELKERQSWFKVKDVRSNVIIKFYWNATTTDTPEVVGIVNYNLAAYINSMLGDAEANAEYIEAAKALYAYSYASELYSK